MILKEPTQSKPVSAPTKSRLGILGSILGIIGAILYSSSLLIIFVIMMAGGGLDIMMTEKQNQAILMVLYCGLFFGMTGGILGWVGLTREENKVADIISIILGVLALFVCSVLVIFKFLFGL